MAEKFILLVEDDPDDEELTLDALGAGGLQIEIVVARDGAEALDFIFGMGKYALRDSCALPHLVLLDLKLPKIGGMEVLRRIRAGERTRLLPVVILTSSSQDSDRKEGYEKGANSYVRKPVDFAGFASAVQQLGLYWLLVNETSA